MVQILLETYKLKEQGIKLVKETFALNPFIEEIVSEMQPLAADVKTSINFTPQTNNPQITADKMQLRRVIKNLISNAIDHSSTQKPIDVKLGKNQGYTTISVIDYGQGIGKDELK